MWLSFFKSALPSRYIVLFIIVTALWIPAFIPNGNSLIINNESISPWFNVAINIPLWIKNIIFIILFYILAIWFNLIALRFNITSKSSSLTAMFFVLNLSIIPFSKFNLSLFLALIFTISFFLSLFNIQKSDNLEIKSFNSGLLLGMASLFYPQIIYWAPFLWIAFIVYRTNTWRPYIASLLGIISPFLFIFWVYFMLNIPITFPTVLIPSENSLISFLISFKLPLLTTAFFFIFTTIVSFRISAIVRNMNIDVRQHTNVILWGFYTLSIVIFLINFTEKGLILMGVPASFIIAAFYDSIKKIKWGKWIVLFYSILIFIMQYQLIFYAS